MGYNVYYGDGYSAIDGNWNNTSNWYISLAVCCCGTTTRGTNYSNGVPQPGDTVYLIGRGQGSAISLNTATTLNIVTGPSGGWNGPLNVQNINGIPNIIISTGTYTGPITIIDSSIQYSYGSVPINLYGCLFAGGTFTGPFILRSNQANFVFNSGPGPTVVISGGVYTGNFQVYNGCNLFITGGTFAATTSTTINNNKQISNLSALPNDPGFSNSYNQYIGGNYVLGPVQNFTNNSNIVTSTNFSNYFPTVFAAGKRVWFTGVSTSTLSSNTYILSVNTLSTQMVLSNTYTGVTTSTASPILIYSVSTSSPSVTISNAGLGILGAGLL